MSATKNKVVWITGASSGIGEALAKAFAAEGAKIILSARRTEELERVKRSLNLPESDVLILPLDLSNTSKTNELTQTVINKFGRIDILINNGGISQRSLTLETPMEIDRKIMEINFFGTIALTKSVLPFMIKQQSGHIVVMSSIAGKFGFFFRSAYSASKHALHGFFEALRMEIFNDHVNVLLVCPGKIKTDISVNAITGNGGKHNKMDPSQAQGLSAEACAEQVLRGIKNNSTEIFIGGKELRAIWVKRFFPNLFTKLIRKQKPE
ncbi:MAG: SDR family oxidoreductase [Bacteroidetes bacterium]|nr:SDR family oxidoreductase [Bacteroidota bacterium]